MSPEPSDLTIDTEGSTSSGSNQGTTTSDNAPEVVGLDAPAYAQERVKAAMASRGVPATISNFAESIHNTANKKKPQKDRVAIIGAGVAGCAMAAALRDYSIDFVVYDKHAKAGGLWAENYPGVKVGPFYVHVLVGHSCVFLSSHISSLAHFVTTTPGPIDI